MSPRMATLVLSGGGAKGAFQAGAEQVLRQEAGFEWERIFGVSVGALNGTLLAQLQYDRLLEAWKTIRESDVYLKVEWPLIAWRLVVQQRLGIYDGSPLRSTLEKYAAGHPFYVPLHIGRVSLLSGKYELVGSDSPDILEAVFQSATMPVIWDPIGPLAYVDGGLRNVTPLGDALAFEPTELVVITCNPDDIAPVSPPRSIIDVVLRSLTDITINEIMVEDVREFVRINAPVLQASNAGLTLYDEDGRPFRYCPITVIRPVHPLGDSLDFSRGSIEYRLQAGRDAAYAWLDQAGA